jgi:hypothetical protein
MKGACHHQCTQAVHFQLGQQCPFCDKIFTSEDPAHSHLGFHFRQVKRGVKEHAPSVDPQAWFKMMLSDFQARRSDFWDPTTSSPPSPVNCTATTVIIQVSQDSLERQALHAFQDYVETVLMYSLHGYCIQHMKGGCRQDCTEAKHFRLGQKCPFCDKKFTPEDPAHSHLGFHYRQVKRGVKEHAPSVDPQAWFKMMLSDFEERKSDFWDSWFVVEDDDDESSGSTSAGHNAEDEESDAELEDCDCYLTKKELEAAEEAALVEFEAHVDTMLNYWWNGYCFDHLQGVCHGCAEGGKHFEVGQRCPFCGEVLDDMEPIWSHLGHHLLTAQVYVQEFASCVNPQIWFKMILSAFEESTGSCINCDKMRADSTPLMPEPEVEDASLSRCFYSIGLEDDQNKNKLDQDCSNSLTCSNLPAAKQFPTSQQDLDLCCHLRNELAAVAEEMQCIKEQLLNEVAKNKTLAKELRETQSKILDFRQMLNSLKDEMESTKQLLEEEKYLRTQEGLEFQRKIAALEMLAGNNYALNVQDEEKTVGKASPETEPSIERKDTTDDQASRQIVRKGSRYQHVLAF